MALITLLRHSAVPKEYQNSYLGHTDIKIDNELIDFSKLNKIDKNKYELFFSSDLTRCKQTLDLLEIEYIVDNRLREIKFKKDIELKRFSQIEKLHSYDKKYLDSFDSWNKFICEESLEEFSKRVGQFLNEIDKNKNILICSHAGTIKLIYSLLEPSFDYEKDYLKLDYLDSIDINIS